MKQITDKGIYVTFLRYSPTIGVLCYAIHYALLPFGIRSILPDYIIDASLLSYLFVMISSKVFGFCRLHRAFITYIGAASLDIDLHHWFDLSFLPDLVVPVCMVLAAVILFVRLFILLYKKRGHDCS